MLNVKSLALILSLSLSLISCRSLPSAPKPPQVTEWGFYFDVDPSGFYAIDPRSKDEIFAPPEDPQMKAAQCMTADDAIKYRKWLSDFEAWAIRNCNPRAL